MHPRVAILPKTDHHLFRLRDLGYRQPDSAGGNVCGESRKSLLWDRTAIAVVHWGDGHDRL